MTTVDDGAVGGVDELVVADRAVGRAPASARRRPRRRWRLICGVVVVLVGLHIWVVEPVRLSSDSMAPGLRHGDELIIDKLTYRWRDPQRGEIVTASDPGTGGWIIKRVVAVGGDSIGIEDGILVRNGEPVVEPYVNTFNMAGVYFGPVDVPLGDVFLLGDNRADSIDSRTFGPVDVRRITGRLAASW
jgi:signal peptidase I